MKNAQTEFEQTAHPYLECLLTVSGDTALLNTFDKVFRSGYGPQWADRPESEVPRYSFHALFPVPEDVQRRGFGTAGRLWCKDYWEAAGDLQNMQVKRVLGERRYRFFTPEKLPKNLFRVSSRDYPTLCFQLAALDSGEERLYHYIIKNGGYHGGYSQSRANSFAAMREELGFAP